MISEGRRKGTLLSSLCWLNLWAKMWLFEDLFMKLLWSLVGGCGVIAMMERALYGARCWNLTGSLRVRWSQNVHPERFLSMYGCLSKDIMRTSMNRWKNIWETDHSAPCKLTFSHPRRQNRSTRVLFLPFRFRNSERDESNSPSTAKINRSEFLFHCWMALQSLRRLVLFIEGACLYSVDSRSFLTVQRTNVLYSAKDYFRALFFSLTY